MKILLVNNNFRELHKIFSYLTDSGHTNLFPAFDFDEALYISKIVHPDLVILDCKLIERKRLIEFNQTEIYETQEPVHFLITHRNGLDSEWFTEVTPGNNVKNISVPFRKKDLIRLVDSFFKVEPEGKLAISKTGMEKKHNEFGSQDFFDAAALFPEQEIVDFKKQTKCDSIVENALRVMGILEKINLDLRLKNENLQNELLLLGIKQYHFSQFMRDFKKILTNLLSSISREDEACREKILYAIGKVNLYLNDSLWNEFKIRFTEVHPGFYDRLLKDNPSLTESDLRICAFVKMKLSSKEIAWILNHSINTVKVARRRLRLKIPQIEPGVSLMNFLIKY